MKEKVGSSSKIYFFSLLVFLCLVPCVLFFSSCSPQTRPGYAPDFKLPGLSAQHSTIQLSKINKEAPVLLIFWATWCEPCIREIPTLNQWHAKYSQNNKLKIIGINFQEERETIEAFLKSHPMDYPVLLDSDGKVGEAYGLSSLPASVLLAKGGKIRYYGFTLPAEIESMV